MLIQISVRREPVYGQDADAVETTSRSAVLNLGLHCFPRSHSRKVGINGSNSCICSRAKQIWVSFQTVFPKKKFTIYENFPDNIFFANGFF